MFCLLTGVADIKMEINYYNIHQFTQISVINYHDGVVLTGFIHPNRLVEKQNNTNQNNCKYEYV